MKGRDEQCLNTLAYLRHAPVDDPRIQAEWINIRCEVLLQGRILQLNDSQSSMGLWKFVKNQYRRWKACFTGRYISRIHVCIVLNVFQQWVGVNGFSY